jgi:hypothetical protein
MNITHVIQTNVTILALSARKRPCSGLESLRKANSSDE